MWPQGPQSGWLNRWAGGCSLRRCADCSFAAGVAVTNEAATPPGNGRRHHWKQLNHNQMVCEGNTRHRVCVKGRFTCPEQQHHTWFLSTSPYNMTQIHMTVWASSMLLQLLLSPLVLLSTFAVILSAAIRRSVRRVISHQPPAVLLFLPNEVNDVVGCYFCFELFLYITQLNVAAVDFTLVLIPGCSQLHLEALPPFIWYVWTTAIKFNT